MGIFTLAATNPLLTASPGLMIWTLITFVLAMVIMYKLAFKKIQAALDARRQAIIDSVDNAERAKQEARDMLKQYRAQLAEGRKEAAQIVERARVAGDELTARMRAEADEQRQRAMLETKSQVQQELDKAMEQIRASVVDMTTLATDKLLRGVLDVNAHEQLIEQAVDELDFAKLQKVGAN